MPDLKDASCTASAPLRFGQTHLHAQHAEHKFQTLFLGLAVINLKGP